MPDPKAPLPGHFVVVRHQEGDAWDYVVITYLGIKTVEAADNPAPPDKRDLSDWHNDTFVNGPSWDEFTRAMGIEGDAAGKTAGSVYAVSAIRFSEEVRDCTGAIAS